MHQIHSLSIQQLREAIRAGELSVREVCRAFLDRVDRYEGRVKSFLHFDADAALAQADELDRRRSAGSLPDGLLTGIPIAVKDVIVTRDMETTCGSKILQGYRPPYDATVVSRLRGDGALVFGKTNCDEFAMGSSTENSAYDATHNPWDLERVPGGSSGGSAACVSAALAPASLGTDTGGSIRQPAAFCGVVGLKPSYGRVSRYGLVAFASSLDQIGPFARSVRDCAAVLQVLAGKDQRDGTSSRRPVESYLDEIGKEVRGLRIGLAKEWMGQGLEPQIRDSILSAVKKLEGLGCRTSEVSFPHSEYAIASYYIIAPAEASSNLARYDGVRYGFRSPRRKDLQDMYASTRSKGFGEEVKRRIMLGTYVLSAGYYDAYYLKASRVRRLIQEDYLKAFQQVDLVIGPTTPSVAFKIGEKTADPLEMYLSDIYTVTANLAGIPGLSLPGGLSRQGLPIGIQLLGPHFQEGKLLRVAYALEQELGLDLQPPLD